MRLSANDLSNNDNLAKDKALATFTVASSYAKGLLAAFKVIGLEVDNLLMDAQVNVDQWAVPENRVGFGEIQSIWLQAIETYGSDSIGLKVGQVMPAGHWGLIEMLALNSETLGEAFELALGYWRLVSDTGKQFRISSSGDTVTLSFWSPFFSLPEANEADMVYLERRIKLMLGSDVSPIRYQFSHGRHGTLTEKDYTNFLSAPILFGCDVNAVILPAEVFDRQIATSSSELKQVVHEISVRQLKALNSARTTAEKVKALVNSGLYGLEKVASLLNVSPRTLQRRLKEEKTAFQDLVNSVRKDKARDLLKNREYSIQEISFILGYQNERAFYDAVQRWFGTTPSGVIAQLQRQG